MVSQEQQAQILKDYKEGNISSEEIVAYFVKLLKNHNESRVNDSFITYI